MIETKEQWFKTLSGLMNRLGVAGRDGNPSAYQVMTQIKKFLVVEKIGPQDLAQELIAVLDAGIMRINANEIQMRMRDIVLKYKKNKMNDAKISVQQKQENQKPVEYWNAFFGLENE